MLRGLLRNGLQVSKGAKLGEIDPTGSQKACFTIRPKMKVIARGVLEAIAMHYEGYDFSGDYDDLDEVEVFTSWQQKIEER